MSNGKAKKTNELLKLIADIPVWFAFLCFSTIFWMVLLIGFCGKYLYGIADKTGPIGDTLGGITAPFIGILNAVLVYRAFRQQLLANKLLLREQRQDENNRDFDVLEKLWEKVCKTKEITYALKYAPGSTAYYHSSLVYFLQDYVRSRLQQSYPLLSKQAQSELFYAHDTDEDRGYFKPNTSFTYILSFYEMEVKSEGKDLIFYFERDGNLLETYIFNLTILFSWFRRLDKSLISEEDKIFLLYICQAPEFFKDRFGFAKTHWIYSLIQENDPTFLSIKKMESYIESVISKNQIDYSSILP